MIQYIVITGNPVDGFTYTGPFDTFDEAHCWATEFQTGDDWWIARLRPQSTEDQ